MLSIWLTRIRKAIHTFDFHLPILHLSTNLTPIPRITLTTFTTHKGSQHQVPNTPAYTSQARFTEAFAHADGPEGHEYTKEVIPINPNFPK